MKNIDRLLLKNNIQITYIGNKGSDYGGLKRDFFIKLSRELLNPDYGLFVQSSSMSYYPNYLSYVNPDHLKYFKFAGMIIAKALMQGENLEAHLSTFLLRRIINNTILYKDLKEMDEEKYNSLQWIIQNDVSNIGLSFEVVIKEYDVPKVIPLKENGSNIELLQENKSEYFDLISDFYLNKIIEKQIDAFIEGFDLIIPFGCLKMFIPNELDLLICGIQEIDIDDMKMNTKFISPFNINSPYINLFFDSILKWDQTNLRKLLMFITGSSRVPINGFKTYKDNGNPITIHMGDNKNRLPIARTCTYTLVLPCYETEEELNAKLLLAINETTFQLV